MFGPEVLGCYHPKNSGEDLLTAMNPTPIHYHTVLASDRDGMMWSPMWSVLALWENIMNSTKLARLLHTDGATWSFSFLPPLEQGTEPEDAYAWAGYSEKGKKKKKTTTSYKN